ncbi:MAG: hypothetical protein GY705_09485 [Bacteroidetes bacterium]|nr:hypothetical protein [Bacteroidota bacterium]
MYDFYFGTNEQIDTDPKQWLINIKRMLPRWPNGIPDSEFLAIYDILEEIERSQNPIENECVLVETGSGASTIVMLYFAIRWNTQLFTWDISNNKLAYLRSMLTDTLFKKYLDCNIFNHWKYIPYDSKSEYVGIPVLGELDKKVAFCFFDSEHTWKNLQSELALISPSMADGGVVSIDDGNYSYKNINTAYINMIRAKLDLPKIDIPENESSAFWQETEGVLNQNFKKVVDLQGGTYRKTFKEDIFWSYYEGDRSNMSALGMEKLEELVHRFDAWQVFKKS